MTRTLRMMMIAQDYPPAVGGIQTYAAALAERFADRCAAFCVLAPRADGDDAFDERRDFPTLRVHSSTNWLRVRVLPALLRTAREQGLTTVFTGHWYVAAAALVAKRLGAVRHVFVAAHGQELVKSLLPGPLSPLYAAHRRSVLQAVDGVFPVSGYTGRLVVADGVSADRVTVVPNGTDLSRFELADASARVRAFRASQGLGEGPVLLTVARLWPRKGIDRVIALLPELRLAYPGLRYLVVGAGPDRARLERLAENLSVTSICRFAGQVSADLLPVAYRAADVFVMPARTDGASVEGFGLAFCEAGACARPVVGTDSGGIADAIVDGETGLLVPEEDPLALRTALQRLLSDPALSARLGAQGLRRIEREGTWDHTAEALLGHIARLGDG